MYLFQPPWSFSCAPLPDLYLHSTMYLFQLAVTPTFSASFLIYIPLCIYFNKVFFNPFISPILIYIPLCIYFNLKTGAGMMKCCHTFTFHYVSISTIIPRFRFSIIIVYLHSTMYLFQPMHSKFRLSSNQIFTFHYVSISTYRPERFRWFLFIYIPLCIYFNHHFVKIAQSVTVIYIPLCIYFNPWHIPAMITIELIYIPLCIYFNLVCQQRKARKHIIFTFHYVSISTSQKL